MGYPGICPRCFQDVNLLHHINYAADGRGPQDNGDSGCEVRYVQNYQGYLVFVITLNSIYLNLDNNIAQWSCIGITQPYTGDFSPRKFVIGPNCNEWSLTYLGMMVLICVPLSKRAIQLFPFILTLAMFLAPCQH